MKCNVNYISCYYGETPLTINRHFPGKGRLLFRVGNGDGRVITVDSLRLKLRL